MSVSTGADDASGASLVELLRETARQWKVWFVALASVGIAVMALGPTSEAPPGYVPFFAAMAVFAGVYAVERMAVAPDPVTEAVQY